MNEYALYWCRGGHKGTGKRIEEGNWVTILLKDKQVQRKNTIRFIITLMCPYSNSFFADISFYSFDCAVIWMEKTEHHVPQVQKVMDHFFPLLNSKCCELPYLNKTT